VGKGLDRVVQVYVQLPDLDAGFGVQLAELGGSCFSLLGRTHCENQM
jgi:hypothetical protein